MSAAALLDNVHKSYGAKDALRGVSAEIDAGGVTALLGPNGAGKTTAVAILLGLRRPDRGRARLFGADPRLGAARRSIGAIPQEIGFPPSLRVRELVDLVRAHYERPVPQAELLRRFGLDEVAGRQAGGLSGGQKRRLATALAFAGNPRAVFLDEPTVGLDVDARRSLWGEIRAYAADGGTVLLTTHYLEEAEALASRILVIKEGLLIAEGSPEALRAQVGLSRVRIRAWPLPDLPAVTRTERQGETTTVWTGDVDTLVRALVGQSVSLDGLEVLPASLEEAFLALTQDSE